MVSYWQIRTDTTRFPLQPFRTLPHSVAKVPKARAMPPSRALFVYTTADMTYQSACLLGFLPRPPQAP